MLGAKKRPHLNSVTNFSRSRKERTMSTTQSLVNTTVSTRMFLTKALTLRQIIGLWGVTAAPMLILA